MSVSGRRPQVFVGVLNGQFRVMRGNFFSSCNFTALFSVLALNINPEQRAKRTGDDATQWRILFRRLQGNRVRSFGSAIGGISKHIITLSEQSKQTRNKFHQPRENYKTWRKSGCESFKIKQRRARRWWRRALFSDPLIVDSSMIRGSWRQDGLRLKLFLIQLPRLACCFCY
jgi:hypothetical protein